MEGSEHRPPARPEGLPESPNALETRARAKREEAVAGFFDALTKLADAGTKLLEHILHEEQSGPVSGGGGPGRHIGHP